MNTETITPNLLKIEIFGFVAQLINCGTTKPNWTVNFPQPMVACNHASLKQYQMFIDYVEFFVAELNGA